MKSPYMAQSKQVADLEEITFRGYNNSNNYKNGELFDMKNLSSDGFPHTSVRSSREVVETLTSPASLGSTEDKLYWVDGTDFKYDGVTKGTVTNGLKSFAELNGNIMILPDKKYYNYDTDTFGTIATMPDIDYVTIWNNRAWGVKGVNIYASKLGVFDEWTTFAGLDSDSYATDVADRGDFTGIVNYQGHLVLHKNDFMYEVYGNKPSNFSTQDVDKIGATNHNSIAVVNSNLFYLSNNGIYVYGGGYSDPISENIDMQFEIAASGTDKRKLYISAFDGVNYHLFVFDTFKREWHKEDNLQVIQFATIDNTIYALAIDGNVYKFNSGDEKVAWELETQEYDMALFNRKGFNKLQVRCKLAVGSSINMFVKQDDDDYNLAYSHSGDGRTKTYSIPVKIRNADRFQVKLTGTGQAEIKHISLPVRIGADK